MLYIIIIINTPHNSLKKWLVQSMYGRHVAVILPIIINSVVSVIFNIMTVMSTTNLELI